MPVRFAVTGLAYLLFFGGVRPNHRFIAGACVQAISRLTPTVFITNRLHAGSCSI